MLVSSLYQAFLLILYPFFIYFTLSTWEFLSFWPFMELTGLVFICFLFARVNSRVYSSLVVYYLIQSISSLGLLITWCAAIFINHFFAQVLFSIFILLKMGIFPFNFWYFSSFQNLPSFCLFLGLTVQKLPPIYLYATTFSNSAYLPFWVLILSLIGTAISAGLTASSSLTLTSLLITSSLFNSSWIILAVITEKFYFQVYFFIYSCIIFFLLTTDRISQAPMVFTLMGLPPFPLFFIKLGIVLEALEYASITATIGFMSFVLLLSNILLLVLYFNYLFPSYISKYRSSFKK